MPTGLKTRSAQSLSKTRSEHIDDAVRRELALRECIRRIARPAGVPVGSTRAIPALDLLLALVIAAGIKATGVTTPGD